MTFKTTIPFLQKIFFVLLGPKEEGTKVVWGEGAAPELTKKVQVRWS
jgi:hypothetical protein